MEEANDGAVQLTNLTDRLEHEALLRRSEEVLRSSNDQLEDKETELSRMQHVDRVVDDSASAGFDHDSDAEIVEGAMAMAVTKAHQETADQSHCTLQQKRLSPKNLKMDGTREGRSPSSAHCNAWQLTSEVPYTSMTVGPMDDDNPQQHDSVDETATMRKVSQYMLWRVCLICFLNYLDRTNLSFAAVTMKKDLSLTDYQYGVGSSLFFVSYAALQVPSTCILVKIGAPRFLGLSLLLWGIFSSSFAAMQNVATFYSLRLLLGLAETGAFPGMWWHLFNWYTEEEIGFSYSYTSAVIAAAQVLGGPLAAACLHMDGLLGLAGWRWLFLLQGIPPTVLGIYLYFTLPRSPLDAQFLTSSEKLWLHRRQLHCQTSSRAGTVEDSSAARTEPSRWRAVWNWRVYLLGAMDGLEGSAKYGIIYWAPLIIASILTGSANGGQSLDANQASSAEHTPSPVFVVLLAAIPFGFAAGFTLLNAYHSKRTGERRLHIIIPTFVAAIGLGVLAASLHSHPVLGLLALTVGSIVFAPTAVQSSYPASFLKGTSAATGWAVMNSVANLGGLLGPYLIGAIKRRTGSFAGSVGALAGITALAGIMYTIVLPHIALDPREIRKCEVQVI